MVNASLSGACHGIIDEYGYCYAGALVFDQSSHVISSHTYSMTVSPQSVAIGDLDSDGLPEVVIASAMSRIGLISVQPNLGSSGEFVYGSAPYVVSSVAYNVAWLFLFDMDQDGKVDILFADSNSVKWFQNTLPTGSGGAAHQASSWFAATPSVVYAGAAGSSLGVQYLIAVVHSGNTVVTVATTVGVSCYVQAGGGTWSSALPLVTGASVASVAFGDVDADGTETSWRPS